MMADGESFDQRLQRIAAARGGAVASAPCRTEAEVPQASSPLGVRQIAVGLLAAVALVIGASSLLPMVTEGALPPATVAAGDAGASPNLIMSLLTGAPDGAERKDKAPLAFLPDAPAGWVRVTPLDAEVPEALSVIAAAWPQETGARLDKHPGYPALQAFLKDRGQSGLRSKAKSKTETAAIYLDPAGPFLQVQLSFEPKALGPDTDPAAWIAALERIEAAGLKTGEIIERTELAGTYVINRTKPAGKSRAIRPIDGAMDTQNTLNIAAPVAARAVLRIAGVAAPRSAEALIAAVDRAALQAQLN